MEICVIAAGKPALAYAREGIAFFEQRLKPLAKVSVRYVKAGSSEDVSQRLLDASEGCLRIVLDERGESWKTREFEKRIRHWQLHSVKKIAFLIGAADGHTEALRQKADIKICLGAHTMQHELALLVLMEQIYRVQTLLAGSPYHRD